MTKQIDDLFRYDGTQYAVCGISEAELFDPWPLMNVEPVLWGASTACSRGYQAVYALADSQLIVDELGISLYAKIEGKHTPQVGPPINGVSPTKDGQSRSFFNNHYMGLGYRLDYTGALLLGNGFIRQMYVHMGFQAPWKYKNVVELVFDGGVLVHEFDRSELMETIRHEALDIQREKDRIRLPSDAELWEFVVRSFDRAYKSDWAANTGLTQREDFLRTVGPPSGQSSLVHRFERFQCVRESIRAGTTGAFPGTAIARRSAKECEAALEVARVQGDRRGEATALLELGNAYLEVFATPLAVDSLQLALAIAREIGDQWTEGVALCGLGNAYLWGYNFQQAVDCHEQGLAIARTVGDRILEGVHLGNLATVHRNQGEAFRATELHRQAVSIAREIDWRELEANQLSNLGTACRHLGRVQEAVQYHEEALVIARELGDQRAAGGILGCLGNDCLSRGEFEQAASYFQQALDIARQINDRENEANWLGGLGNATFAPVKDWQIGRVRLRDIPQLIRLSRTVRRAMPFFEQAADIAHEIGHRKAEGVWLGNLGSAYHRVGRMRQAIPYYNRALTIAQEIGDRTNEAGWLRSLGNAYGALKEPERALEYYDQALAAPGSPQDPSSMTILLYNMGLRAKQAGDFGRAREIWTRALALSEPVGLPMAAWIRRMLADLSD